MVSGIICSAGKGERAGFNKNKLLVPFNGKTVLERTFNALSKTGLFDQIIIVCAESDFNEVNALFGENAQIVIGGKTRFQSVKNALEKVEGDIVLIHDGARPFVSESVIDRCIKDTEKFGSSITAVKQVNTTLSVDKEITYLDRDKIYSVQTPQGFFTKDILKAYEVAKGEFTDDGGVYKNLFGDFHITEGEEKNVKLTFKEDFDLLSSYGGFNKDVRFGTGFDCHKFETGRKLILGGMVIPHDKGLIGHSDADVLTHAIMDAILSAVCERDIGYHFPDSDPNFKDAVSTRLLEKVLKIARAKGYKVQSISAVIMAEKPKLLKHIPDITENLAKVIGVSPGDIGIGATTLEGLGFVGREEGICVHANAVLVKI